MLGLISTDNLDFWAVLTRLLNNHLMSGIFAKKGTPEPELLLEFTSKPPKITTS